jgi:sugar lactone lactonase YvrE
MRRLGSFLQAVLAALLVIGFVTGLAMATSLTGDDLLVADQSAGTVRRYSAAGADLGVFASGLSQPSWITMDTGGNVYVSEYTGGRVDKFSSSGALLLTIPTAFAPGDVRVAGDGSIYVADYFGGNVYRYSASGAPLGLFVATGLSRADFTAFDSSGNLYVTDFLSGVVRRISPTGVDLGNFLSGLPASFPKGVLGIAFDSGGNLYAANNATNSVEKYSPSGVALGTFASGLNDPYGLAFDSNGNLFVANYGNGTIREFSASGTDLGNFVSSGLSNPRDVVIVPTPEPSTGLLVFTLSVFGLIGVWWKRDRRKQQISTLR